MTYCPPLLEKVEKDIEVELGKLGEKDRIDLKEFGRNLCGEKIKHPAKKAKNLIKIAMGKPWWEENKAKIVDTSKDSSKSKTCGKKFPHESEPVIIPEIKDADVDETAEEEAENEISILIKPSVQKRLNLLKGWSTQKNKLIETDNRAIRFALKRAGLWNIINE